MGFWICQPGAKWSSQHLSFFPCITGSPFQSTRSKPTKKPIKLTRSKSKSKSVPVDENMNEEGEADEDDYYDDDHNHEDTKAELNKKLLSEITKTRKNSKLSAVNINNKKGLHGGDLDLSKAAKTVASNFDFDKDRQTGKSDAKRTKYVTPPFYRKVYMLWSSPFTKFWANFISYICFLALFGIVTLWPCCGMNFYLFIFYVFSRKINKHTMYIFGFFFLFKLIIFI